MNVCLISTGLAGKKRKESTGEGLLNTGQGKQQESRQDWHEISSVWDMKRQNQQPGLSFRVSSRVSSIQPELQHNNINTTWWAQICYPELSQIMNTRQWHGLEKQIFWHSKAIKATTYLCFCVSDRSPWFFWAFLQNWEKALNSLLQKLKISGVLYWARIELLIEKKFFFVKISRN